MILSAGRFSFTDMSSVNETEPPSSGKKKRSYKNLPLELQDIDRNDIASFVCALELDTTTDTEELRASSSKNSQEQRWK